MENKENVIEFLSGEHYATVTFTNSRHINRIKSIYNERHENFKYIHENEDGSVCAKIPLKWIKINPGSNDSSKKRQMSEAQKERLLEGLKKYREKKK